jgi:hypothetical protein
MLAELLALFITEDFGRKASEGFRWVGVQCVYCGSVSVIGWASIGVYIGGITVRLV